MMNADIITGVSLFLLFVSFGVSQGFTTVVLAHITFCTPYVVLSVMPRLKKMNQNVYEAALDLGATPFQAVAQGDPAGDSSGHDQRLYTGFYAFDR